MVWVPGGEFSMGCADPRGRPFGGDDPMIDARPIHRVEVTGFWMDATEVTTSSRLMIVPSENEHIALLVDRVEDVITVSSTDEEDLPANAGDLDGRYFRSVYKLEHELLILLDVVAVFVDDASRR
jgi:hypothetical protein